MGVYVWGSYARKPAKNVEMNHRAKTHGVMIATSLRGHALIPGILGLKTNVKRPATTVKIYKNISTFCWYFCNKKIQIKKTHFSSLYCSCRFENMKIAENFVFIVYVFTLFQHFK